ncbi:MAG TPA: glycoside hydrolase family 99-like domain-containing protein, partial [bacterium]|nr:glycoside hydrolase family 99-like domain-containing protein [bacterium]
WEIEAEDAFRRELRLECFVSANRVEEAVLSINFLSAVERRSLSYIPEPNPVKTSVVVGAHHCPLWEADKPFMWSQLLKHPERTPALGFYAQENPEVSDWETKWAVEHGVSFFLYCWYRASQGEPVKMRFGSAIHEALFKSRFVNHMKFCIMWENQSRGTSGVADLDDLTTNVLPFWMENYFKHPSYLKMDGKPLLFIYRPEFLIQDLGSEENVLEAFDLMRQACQDAGFDGLYLLGEYRGLDPKHLELMKRIGLDYTFAYCWYVGNNPTPEQAIAAQVDYINKTQALGILPQVVTVSQAWSGWADEGTIWKIPPTEFKTLLAKAKEIIATFPANELGSRMLLLDNWNEWGEGHYIAPYREYGFGYLDAVREVFSDAPTAHEDLIPEDIGLGDYDRPYRTHQETEKALRRQVSRKAFKGSETEEGLVAWWAFDEEEDSPVALDYSGHRLGGIVRDAQYAPGIAGNALVCDGGCVEVPSSEMLNITSTLSVLCWVKTDRPGQNNTWFLNRVLQGGTHTGFRMGVLDGKPSFHIPMTSWSHHLNSDTPLPIGRWVHLAGTFDGTTMRLYMDGVLCGTMERPGTINTNDFHLILGNYDVKHAAHFVGLLDEVKLYRRALSPEEIRSAWQALAEP